jgi:hypothetical protein
MWTAPSYNGQAVEGRGADAVSDWQPGGFAFADAGTAEPRPALPAVAGTAGADLFDVGEAGGAYTGGAGRDLYLFEAGDGHAAVADFASRADKLVFIGFDRRTWPWKRRPRTARTACCSPTATAPKAAAPCSSPASPRSQNGT